AAGDLASGRDRRGHTVPPRLDDHGRVRPDRHRWGRTWAHPGELAPYLGSVRGDEHCRGHRRMAARRPERTRGVERAVDVLVQRLRRRLPQVDLTVVAVDRKEELG